MKTKKVKCIICGVDTRVPAINEPWCDKCVEVERERSTREDWTGVLGVFNRPPKYVIPKSDWKHFGYE